ncbi:MAG: PAS domain S-box protein [Candidatus Aegiribacteria sp.]|nr:PAS domain S-box protein [Candidatus Aegiribacteria sp.]
MDRNLKDFEFVSIGTAIISLEKKILDADDRFCEILGYNRDELLEISWKEISFPADIKKESTYFRSLQKSKINEFSIDKRFLNKTGKIVFTNISVKCFLCGKRSPGYYLILAHDITDRKHMEQNLHSQIELEKLIAAISTGFIVSPGEIDSKINNALKDIGEFSGIDRCYVFQFYDDGKTMNNTHEWCKKDIEPQINILQNISVEEEYPDFTKRIRAFDIIHVPVVDDLPPEASIEKVNFQNLGIKSLILVPIVYAKVLIGFLGFDSVKTEKTWKENDIRLLKMIGEIFANALECNRTEKEIQNLQDYNRGLIEVNLDPLVTFDPDGIILDVNQATIQATGKSREELIGSDITGYFTNPEKALEGVKSVFKFEEIRDYELVLKAVDGSETEVAYNASVFRDNSGKVIGAFAAARDITRRKQAEEIQEVLFQISQAVSASDNLQEFLEIVHQQFGRLVDTSNFYVALYDEENDLYSFPCIFDEYDKNPDFSKQQMKKSLTDYVRRTGKSLLADDRIHQELIRKGEVEMVGKQSPIWLGVPLRTSHGVIGVVAVQSYSQSSLYSMQDLEMMSFVAENISLAIEHKKVEEKLVRYHSHLEELVRKRTEELTETNRKLEMKISEHRQTEEALRDSERRMSEIIDFLPDATLVVNRDSQVIAWNKAMEEMTEVPADEMLRKGDYEYAIPFYGRRRPILIDRIFDSHSETDNLYTTIRQELNTLVGEAFTPALGGQGRYLYATARALYDSQGKLAGAIESIRDITERRKVEQALAESEKRYRTLLVNLPVGVFQSTIDSEGHAISCNISLARMHGFDNPEEMEKVSLTDMYVNPDDRKRFVEAVCSNDSVANFEVQLKRINGGKFWGSMTARAVRDSDGQINCIDGILEDITERKLAEEELQKSEERFRDLVLSTSDWVWEVDTQGRYTYCSEQVANVLDYTAEEIIGKTPFDLMPPEEGARIRGIFNNIVENLAPIVELENWNIRKDGRKICLLTNGVPMFDETGCLIGYRGLDRDITNRKEAEAEKQKLEKQILQTQKLESLGVLAGGIAHDFNNLLVGILGNADLALDSLSPVSPACPNIHEIETAAKRAAELSRQMLAYSGKGQLIVDVISLNDVVKEMAHLLEVSILKNVVLKFNLSDDLPAVEVDVTQIRQVIMNLITNASEAIGEKSGVISITTGILECDSNYFDGTYLKEDMKEGIYVYLEIADTGCGLNIETQSKIFDPFFTTKFTGRGLGLASVLGIVRGHGGSLKLYSEEGHGSTFKILLPAVERRRISLEKETPVDMSWKSSGTILLVDDEETVRTVGETMLQRLGFTVLTATDGRDAIDIYRKNSDEIRCVILDLTMPHMSGEEAFIELRRIRNDIKILLSSGYNEQDVIQRFSGMDIDGFIQKPYRFADLVCELRTILEK